MPCRLSACCCLQLSNCPTPLRHCVLCLSPQWGIMVMAPGDTPAVYASGSSSHLCIQAGHFSGPGRPTLQLWLLRLEEATAQCSLSSHAWILRTAFRSHAQFPCMQGMWVHHLPKILKLMLTYCTCAVSHQCSKFNPGLCGCPRVWENKKHRKPPV